LRRRGSAWVGLLTDATNRCIRHGHCRGADLFCYLLWLRDAVS